MGSSYTNVNVHIIFHVKQASCVLLEDDMSRVFHYLGGIIRSLSGHAYMIGGRPDHIHILTSLPKSSSLSDYVRKIKSNSSKWIKGLRDEYNGFLWQDGYGAFSVSESNVDSVARYITYQKEHHAERSAQQEYMLFLEKNGFCLNLETGEIRKRE